MIPFQLRESHLDLLNIYQLIFIDIKTNKEKSHRKKKKAKGRNYPVLLFPPTHFPSTFGTATPK